MDKKVDMTLYNQIIAKFSPKPGTMMAISLTSNNVDELVALSFEEYQMDDFFVFRDEHLDNRKSYVAFDYMDDEITFSYVSKEFKRSQNLTTGKTERFELDPFRYDDIDMEQVKKEFAQLSALLFNSKAS